MDLEETEDRLARQKDALRTDRKRHEDDLAEGGLRVVGLEEQLGVLEQSVIEAARTKAAIAADQKVAEERGGELRERLKVLSEQIENQRRQVHLIQARESGQAEVLVGLERDAARLAEEEKAASQQQQELEAESTGLVQELATARDQEKECETAVRNKLQRLEEVRGQRPHTDERSTSLRDERVRLAKVISEHERALARLGQAESERDMLRTEIIDELDVEPSSLRTDGVEPPDDSEIRRLRMRAAQYADVDPSVVDECRHLEERQQHLRRHVEDLKAAERDLNEIMALADTEMRRRFQSALTAVNAEFSRVFQLMLQGGDARLEQIDAEGGIDIRAQLPGRRTRSSAAFSGGERALVASSLLFGVLKIRPTPFCILDEVDAALDETNVDRYLDVLRDVSRTTQMIVVTHNRATMAAADVLYGLTMDEEGVSSLLSIRLDAFETAV
jgi:chromosome segregation protein